MPKFRGKHFYPMEQIVYDDEQWDE